MADIIINESGLYTKANDVGASYTDLASPNNRTASPNYCPTKSNITSQVPNSFITGTYASNQLVCEKDVHTYTSGFYIGLAYNDIPANGNAISFISSPTVRFNVDGTTIDTTYPSTTYGTWSFSKVGGSVTINTSNGQVSASSLGTTVKSRTSIGTVACTFTASSTYGDWSVTSSATIYQQLNQVDGFEDVLDLTFPTISYSAHIGSTSYNDVRNMGADDIDPIYRQGPLNPTSLTGTITYMKYTSGSRQLATIGLQFDTYFIQYGTSDSNCVTTTSGKTLDLLQNGINYGFSYSTSSSSYMVENVHTNIICLYTTACSINSSRDFTITINNYNNTLKSAVYVTGNYRADGNRTLITHYTPSLTKTFTQLNSGVIKLECSASTVGYEFILFKQGTSTNTINVYTNSLPYGFNEYGVVGTGNTSGKSEIINYTKMPIVVSISSNQWAPMMQEQNVSYVKVLRLQPKSGSNSYRIAYDPSGGGNSSIDLVINPYYGGDNLTTAQRRCWYPRADYTVDISSLS